MAMAMAHGVHLPHIHLPYPHVGQPQDQTHREGTKPSALGGIVLGLGVIVALATWATALIVLFASTGLGVIVALATWATALIVLFASTWARRTGTTSTVTSAWTAVAIASAFSLFLMGSWKANRA